MVSKQISKKIAIRKFLITCFAKIVQNDSNLSLISLEKLIYQHQWILLPWTWWIGEQIVSLSHFICIIYWQFSIFSIAFPGKLVRLINLIICLMTFYFHFWGSGPTYGYMSRAKRGFVNKAKMKTSAVAQFHR